MTRGGLQGKTRGLILGIVSLRYILDIQVEILNRLLLYIYISGIM